MLRSVLLPVPSIRLLLVLLVLAVYVPALVAAAGLIVLQYRTAREQAQEDLLDRTVLLARELRLRIEGFQSHLERLAQEAPASADLSTFELDARRTASAAGFDAIVLCRGGVQLVNTGGAPGENLPAGCPQAVLDSARTGRPALSNLMRGPVSGRNIVGISLPVLREGQVRFVLTGLVEASALQDLVQGVPAGWTAAIADARGVVVARNRSPETYVGQLVTEDVRQHLARDEQGVHSSVTLDGVPSWNAFRTPPSVGWTALVAVPQATLHRPVLHTAVAVGIGALAVLSISLWLAMRLRRSIVRSVNALVGEALNPPEHLPAEPLAFAEANDLRERLHDSARALALARRWVERMHSDFQRALVLRSARRDARIAAELHDNVGSALAAIALLLARLEPLTTAKGSQLLHTARQQIDKAAAAVRHVSRGMMPTGAQRGGLPAALDELAAEFSGPGLCCAFHCRGDFSGVSTEIAGHAYRIAQEAVTNAVRHGHVSRIRILLAGSNGCCRLTIDDDGIGYDVAHAQGGGIGLRSMRARALAVDGRIEFPPPRSPLGGARVRLTFPKRMAAEAAEPFAASTP